MLPALTLKWTDTHRKTVTEIQIAPGNAVLSSQHTMGSMPINIDNKKNNL